jgi:peptide/nickel transport system permease protein
VQLFLKMLLQRVLFGLVTLFIISVITFFAVDMLPGDVTEVILGQAATPETIAAFRAQLGLDQPPLPRYLSWANGVLRGDFGVSMANQIPVAELIRDRLDSTIFLATFTAIVSVPLALGMGILSALYRGSLFDRTMNISALCAVSFPEFFVAYIAIFVFSTTLGLFPSISNINPDAPLELKLYQSVLPMATLTLGVVAQMMRMTRVTIISVMASPYVEMAKLKGIKRSRIIFYHVLPNVLAPIANVVALNLAYLVVGVVVVEVVFVYPGLGQLLVDSVTKRDLPVVQICCLLFATTYVLLNMLADILSIASNPRLMNAR